MFTAGNESKVKLTRLTTVNTEGDKLPVFVNFRDQTITPEIGRQPRYLEAPAISNCFSKPLRVRDSGVLLYSQRIFLSRSPATLLLVIYDETCLFGSCFMTLGPRRLSKRPYIFDLIICSKEHLAEIAFSSAYSGAECDKRSN